ncbi:FBD-associated F-box protein [Cardamine amara subsp. amara]|uniref:FBD-associated F-box protein n=1 Tax=Cardamine amara subsp. amara TaxID=228776 RepID=A0ABD0ZNE7_CARAN
MSESSNKRIKLLESKNLPEDLVVSISSFLPIQSLLRNRIVSKNFRHTEIKSLDLDFSGVFSVRRRKLKVVKIIENIFNQHEGSNINRFVLILNHIGVEDMILSWINTCISKNIQELELDFSKSKKVLKIPIDFSAIETLTALKLRWCKFEIPDNSTKGLRNLKTLSLKQTEVMKEMIDAIFSNCIHLESLELIECRMYGILSIYAQNHEKFKSLVVSSMPKLLYIILNAPTLKYYKYDGYIMKVIFLRRCAVEEASLFYKQRRRSYDSSDLVVANMRDNIEEFHSLEITNFFLEALTYRYVEGKLIKPSFKFENLLKFRIVFKAPAFCSLFDIAEFLKGCPKLEQVLIDIKNFTFERNMFWEIHHKKQIQNENYRLECLKEVKIIGYKGHCHELDIVQFFVENAPSLKKLDLEMLKNEISEAHVPDYERISYIKNIFPGVEVTEV